MMGRRLDKQVGRKRRAFVKVKQNDDLLARFDISHAFPVPVINDQLAFHVRYRPVPGHFHGFRTDISNGFHHDHFRNSFSSVAAPCPACLVFLFKFELLSFNKLSFVFCSHRVLAIGKHGSERINAEFQRVPFSVNTLK